MTDIELAEKIKDILWEKVELLAKDSDKSEILHYELRNDIEVLVDILNCLKR